MNAYHAFALVYDRMMEEIPYEEWCNFVTDQLKKFGIEDGLMLELGCGTGTLTEMFDAKGFDMIGVDNSEEMLAEAVEKREQSGRSILYLNQDMREFELYGTVNAIVSVCDSVNYITEPEELQEVFRLVNNYLDPKGVFIFDFNTVHKYRDVMGDTVIAEDRGECSFIWDNYYYEEERINEYELTLFIQEESEQEEELGAEDEIQDGALYRRYHETHYQRGYTVEEMKQLIEAAGLEYVAAYDAFSHKAPDQESERVYIVAREAGK